MTKLSKGIIFVLSKVFLFERKTKRGKSTKNSSKNVACLINITFCIECNNTNNCDMKDFFLLFVPLEMI